MENIIKLLENDLNKTKLECFNIIEEFKNNKLFNLLWDSKETTLSYQFTMCGINFGDNYIPTFLKGFKYLYHYHISDDGGIRYNIEELERYNESIKTEHKLLKESLEKGSSIYHMKNIVKPSWFTMNEKPLNNENCNSEYLNGNGDTEEQIYETCIKYLKEDYFWFYDFNTMKIKDNVHIKTTNLEKYLPLIEKYLL